MTAGLYLRRRWRSTCGPTPFVLSKRSSAFTRAHEQQQEQARLGSERAIVIAARSTEFQRLTEGYRLLGTARRR